MTVKQDIDRYLSNPPFPAPYMWWLRRLIEDEAGTAISQTVTGSGKRELVTVFDGGSSYLEAGMQGDVSLDFSCTITGWRILAAQAGNLSVGVWKDAYANYPPTIADSITAAAPPTLTAANKNEDTTLTGWTTSVAAGDTFRFNITSIGLNAISRFMLSLSLTEV